jgi:hypothetical protein
MGNLILKSKRKLLKLKLTTPYACIAFKSSLGIMGLQIITPWMT